MQLSTKHKRPKLITGERSITLQPWLPNYQNAFSHIHGNEKLRKPPEAQCTEDGNIRGFHNIFREDSRNHKPKYTESGIRMETVEFSHVKVFRELLQLDVIREYVPEGLLTIGFRSHSTITMWLHQSTSIYYVFCSL